MPINLHIVCDPSSFEPLKDWERVEDFQPCDVNDQGEAYTERDSGPKYRAITKYEQSSRNLLLQTRLLSHLVGAQTVMIYTSWGGNPVHRGHMGMIAKAINHFVTKGVFVQRVCVSLSYESYIRGKVEGANFNIMKENAKKPLEEKSLLKVLLSRSDRINCLNAAVQEMREENQFHQVPVEYYDDQGSSEVDHPEGYRKLVSNHPAHKIYYLCGSDHCVSMGNWSGEHGRMRHVIIITRDHAKPTHYGKEIQQIETPDYSRIILEGDAIYQGYSSSRIQNGEYDLLPKSVAENFQLLHEQAQTI